MVDKIIKTKATGDLLFKNSSEVDVLRIDDSTGRTIINQAQITNGAMTKIENDSSFSIIAGYSMVHSNMIVKAATTVTVEATALLDVFDEITVIGTLDVLGTSTIR